jgi:hypothetical protein
MSNYHQLCTSEVIDPHDITIEKGTVDGDGRICIRIRPKPIMSDVPEHIHDDGWISMTDHVARELLSRLAYMLKRSPDTRVK